MKKVLWITLAISILIVICCSCGPTVKCGIRASNKGNAEFRYKEHKTLKPQSKHSKVVLSSRRAK